MIAASLTPAHDPSRCHPLGWPHTAQAILFLARIGLGCLLIWSALLKIRHPFDFLYSVYDYELVGRALGICVAIVVPWVELVLGLCLTAGLLLGGAILGTCALMLLFTLVQASTVWRGLSISCGCFGNSGGQLINYTSLLRDFAILALCFAALLIWIKLRSTLAAPVAPASPRSSVPDS